MPEWVGVCYMCMDKRTTYSCRTTYTVSCKVVRRPVYVQLYMYQ